MPTYRCACMCACGAPIEYVGILRGLPLCGVCWALWEMGSQEHGRPQAAQTKEAPGDPAAEAKVAPMLERATAHQGKQAFAEAIPGQGAPRDAPKESPGRLWDRILNRPVQGHA